jgi:hypothetical protein
MHAGCRICFFDASRLSICSLDASQPAVCEFHSQTAKLNEVEPANHKNHLFTYRLMLRNRDSSPP